MLKLEALPLFALKDGSLLAYCNVPEDKAIATQQVSKEFIEDVPF